MGLLELPTELRLHIFECLPDLSYGRHETIGPNVRLTPAICRVSQTLRKEALPIYAKTSSFVIHVDNVHNPNSRIHIWLQALGEDALAYVENVQLSRDWCFHQPSRWQGHIGFYVRLQQFHAIWQCTTGTYPIANDTRAMRLESVDLLRSIITQRLGQLATSGEKKGLTRSDVEFIVEAMDIVASYPISSYDTEQSENGRKRRREIWMQMERDLFALQAST